MDKSPFTALVNHNPANTWMFSVLEVILSYCVISLKLDIYPSHNFRLSYYLPRNEQRLGASSLSLFQIARRTRSNVILPLGAL